MSTTTHSESLPAPADSLLFSRYRFPHLELPNRIWLPAMVTWLGTEEGTVTEDIRQRYLRYALGEPGMIVMEATGIHEVSSGPLLRVSHNRFIPGLRRLVDQVHQVSPSKVSIQIIHFLRVATRNPTRYLARLAAQDPKKYAGMESLSESDLEQRLSPRQWREYSHGYRQLVEDLNRDEVQALPSLFAAAAGRVRQAGFDAVELHFAHAYTMASFLSRNNGRQDEYGGQSLENRARLPLEIIRAVRREVGDDFTVGCRFLGREDIAGGSELEDACYFAVRFAEAGLDFLSMSRGGKFEDAKQPKVGQAVYPYTGYSGQMCMPPGEYPAAYNHPLARTIKISLQGAGYATPLVTCGRIQTYELAESILQKGEADMIGMARQLLADPDWPKKIRDGRGRVVYCDYRNVCEALDRNHLPVRCKLWLHQPRGQMHPPVTDYATDRSRTPVPLDGRQKTASRQKTVPGKESE